MKAKTTLISVKNKVIQIKNETITFVRNHKHELIEGSLCIGGALLSAKYIQKSHDNDYLSCENKFLNNTNSKLLQRINELESLCAEKDRIMDKTMSDGLRCRSSEAGRQMANKRHYLNTLHS